MTIIPTNNYRAPSTQEMSVELALREIEKSPKPSSFGMFTKFGALLLKYGAERDPLSQELLIAGGKFMVYVVDKVRCLSARKPREICFGETDINSKVQENEEKLIMAMIKETVDKVEEIRKILQNPYGTSIYEDPCLVGGVATWNKTTYDEYRRLAESLNQHFVEAKPHNFAQELLEWIKPWPRQARNIELPSNPILDPDSTLPQVVKDYKYFTLYQEYILKSIKLQRVNEFNVELEQMVNMLEDFNVKEFERFSETVSKIEESNKLQVSELERCVDSLESQQKETKKIFTETNDVLKSEVRMLESGIAEISNQKNRLQEQLTAVTNLLHSCRQQMWALEDQLDNVIFF